MPPTRTPKPFRYVRLAREEGNIVELESRPHVEVSIPFRRGCERCEELERALRALDGVRAVRRRRATKHHHESLRVLGGGGAEAVLEEVSLSGIRSAAGLRARLSRLFLAPSRFRARRHQKRLAAAFAEDGLPHCLLVAFALGSGKTHASLHLAHAQGFRDVIVVCGNSLIGQWVESIRAHAPPHGVRYRVLGYQRFEAEAHADRRGLCRNSLVIVDEAHRYKNMTEAAQTALEALRNAKRLILLTGTPLRNDVRDLDFLLTMMGAAHLIPPPEEDQDAGNPYADQALLRRIHEALRGRVALYDPRVNEPPEYVAKYYPERLDSTRFHELTWQQVAELQLYGQGVRIRVGPKWAQVGGKGGSLTRMAIMNASVDSETGELYSSKADAVAAGIRAVGGFPQVVYSRFNRNLLAPLLARLEQDFASDPATRDAGAVRILSGNTRMEDRKPLLDAYNAGKVAVLLICKVGSEGLDLHAATRALHLLEPQENVAAEEQVVGRVIRFRASTNKAPRPAVHVVRYVGRWPTSPPDAAARRYIGEVVEAHPTLDRAFAAAYGKKGASAGRRDRASDVVRWLQESMREPTDEERAYEANLEKEERLKPLKALLWGASSALMGPVPLAGRT